MSACLNCGLEGMHADYCSAGQRRAEPAPEKEGLSNGSRLAIFITFIVLSWIVLGLCTYVLVMAWQQHS